MSAPHMLVSVPKPKRDSFRPHRPLERNALVRAQVRHFQEAERHLPPELQTGIHADSISTEGEASDYIKKVTEAIHRAGGRVDRVKRAP